MPFYLALQSSTKLRLRQGAAQHEVEPISADEELLVLMRNSVPDETVERYDVVAMDFVPIAPPVTWNRTKISVREFRNRLGQAVRLQILALRRSTEPSLASTRDLLEDMKETLDSVNEVDLENADTQAGVAGLAQLGQAGLLTFSAADAARVLAPSTVEAE